MFDLWGDEKTPVIKTEKKVTLKTDKNSKDLEIRVSDETIEITTQKNLESHPDFKLLYGVQKITIEDVKKYLIPLRAVNAFILRYMLRSFSIDITPVSVKKLSFYADKINLPQVSISETGKHLDVKIPPIDIYREVIKTLNGYPVKEIGYRINITRIMDFEALSNMMETSLPKFNFSKNVKALTTSEIKGFDGTIESLKNISIGELNIVKANSQSYKAIKKSQKTIQEKIEKFGIVTLYDLYTWLPKRYIDKTEPQNLKNLIVDEKATILGKIVKINDLSKNMGVSFTIEISPGEEIPVSFWRQSWLKNKFKINDEVLVTGKFILWNRKPQLNGISIEDAKEAAVLPIVPIYKQSETQGITTAFLLAAVREMFSRLGPIELPEYLRKKNRMNYYEAFKELHLPESLSHHKKVIDSLAYYELVNMQLLIQEARENAEGKEGISQVKSKRNLQAKAIKTLPFELTGSQKKAVQELNSKLEDSKPSSTLLNADVGAGKTLCAQLACLRSVEAGYQTVLMAPTDILARQLYSTFEKLLTSLEAQGETLKMVYLHGGMKVKEKREILKEIKEGAVDIIVGTHSAMSASVEYNNLGFIAIDEQQKFGAEQRSRLLNSRSDGKIPDLLMQTATPIPRSTAQVFYGDVDMILLDEKPPGRLPIITEWIQEDPNELLGQGINQLWNDISEEASKGNQTFVITPLVRESTSVDSASVERTFKILSENIFSNLKVGFVHGQMKHDEQKETMEAFRRKEYDILVASTVVEVGVDIPDATRVLILSADRLGASSLHQIRGRVGRNSKQSKCYLVSAGNTENSVLRLQSLVDNDNGFEVAKADLQVRGEGTMFSSEQSGASEMMFASLARHSSWVDRAREEALTILDSKYREQALQDSREKFKAEGRLV